MTNPLIDTFLPKETKIKDMKYKIKETCPCGAVLEFEEVVAELWQQETSNRQAAFQEAHARCRQQVIHGQPIGSTLDCEIDTLSQRE